VLVWLSVWSEMHTCIWPSWCHCHSLPLASVKSRQVLPFWYQLTQVVPEKGPLNGCVWSLITQQLTSTSGWTVKRLARSISASRSWRRRSSASSFSRASSCWRRMRSSAPRLFSSAMHGDDCQSLIRTGNISKIRLHHTTNISNAVTCTKWVTKTQSSTIYYTYCWTFPEVVPAHSHCKPFIKILCRCMLHHFSDNNLIRQYCGDIMVTNNQCNLPTKTHCRITCLPVIKRKHCTMLKNKINHNTFMPEYSCETR